MLVQIESPWPICDFQLVNNTNLAYVITRTIFSRSSGQIIAFDTEVSLVNALILGNLGEYCHKSYIYKT